MTLHETLQGRYHILRPLGRGGFGAVYLAEDQRLGRRVAIKEMCVTQLPADEQAISAQLFEREALMLAQLDHPNLVRVWDYFQHDHRAFLVMEYVDGVTLREALNKQGGPLPEALVIACALQLCAVLAYLHSRQPPVIFRDLKPANVMLAGEPDLVWPNDEPHVKLIDFGIARIFKADQSSDTLVVGTPGYAPPEQYGQGQTDERSDLYSLGATLHQLLTGRPPQGTPLAPLATSDAHISPALARIVDRAVALDPTLRYQSAEAMRRDLLACVPSVVSAPQPLVPAPAIQAPRIAANAAARTRLPPAPAAPAPPRQTPPLLLVLLIVAVLGALTVGGVALSRVTSRDAGEATSEALGNAPTSVPTLGPSPVADSDVEWLLPGAPGRIAYGQADSTSTMYDLMIATLDGQPPQRLTQDGASISPAWASDGRLAFASMSGRDRQGIVTGSLEQRRFDPVVPPTIYARYPSWSPDNSKLAFGSGTGRNGPFKLAILDLASRTISYPGPNRVAWISWSRTGPVAYGARQNADAAQDIFVLNGNNTPRDITNTIDQEEDFPDWSPDGRKIVFVSSPEGAQNLSLRHIYVMNADGSGRVQLTKDFGPHTNPVWSPDGRWIAFLSMAGGDTWQVWAMRADGSQPRQLTFGPVQKFYLAWGK